MPHANRQLGQLRPANNTAVSIYSPSSGVITKVNSIFIVNTTTTSATFRIFHDDNGTTYDESTALYYDAALAGNTTILITDDPIISMNDSTGNLAVRTGTASALTFTIYGDELPKFIR